MFENEPRINQEKQEREREKDREDEGKSGAPFFPHHVSFHQRF